MGTAIMFTLMLGIIGVGIFSHWHLYTENQRLVNKNIALYNDIRRKSRKRKK